MKTRSLYLLIGCGLLGAASLKVARTHHSELQSSDSMPLPSTSSSSATIQGKSRIRRDRTPEEEFARAQAYFSDHQMDAARDALRTAIEKDPNSPKYRRQLVKWLKAPFEFEVGPLTDELLAHLHWLASYGHARPGDFHDLWTYELMRKDPAETNIQRSEKLAKRYPAMRKLEGYRSRVWEACFRDGDYGQVVSEAKAVLARDGSGSPQLHFVLARSLEQLGDSAGALEHLRVHYNEGEDGGWSAYIEPHIRRLEARLQE